MSDSKTNDPPPTESETKDAATEPTPSEARRHDELPETESAPPGAPEEAAPHEPVPHDDLLQAAPATTATTSEQTLGERVTHDDLPQAEKPKGAASEAASLESAAHDDLPRAEKEPVAAPSAEPAQREVFETVPAAAPTTEVPGAAPAAEAEDAQEVEPEIIPLPRIKPKHASHHPPPPPSLRVKSVVVDAAGAGAQLAEIRFPVAGKPKIARELMSRKLFTIGPNDTLEHLEEHMQAFRFRHLPVIDGDRLVGLITHRDLLHASSSFLSDRARERDEIIHKLPASRIMRTDLVTARPDTPLDQIAKLMWQRKIGCVLVTEEDGSLVGILTESDFIRLAHHFLVQPA